MDTGLFIVRLFLGVPFIVWGIGKLRGGDAKIAPLIARLDVPDPKFFALMVAICETTGGLMIVLGWPVRTAALLLGLWCLLTGNLEHRGNQTEFLKNATMAGAFSRWWSWAVAPSPCSAAMRRAFWAGCHKGGRGPGVPKWAVAAGFAFVTALTNPL